MSPRAIADSPDLLDFLAEVEQATAARGVHCILPNMSIACGEDLIALCRRRRGDRARRTTTTTTTETTCPDCLAVGDLRAISRAMNGQQAGVK
ncbi:hypothetical protein SANBI_001659 [Sanguibacter sp. 4.1]|uniref:Uncharacterized protein n=1 Tax=Sanguibacter biliveldensis TaxID=3030830 RepID=A0AAF0Z7C2_9MICO|nr:hypothetical protein [Sanguibacter sp. 4.1]WPF83948.1 hypothetical protein SANBI_001659 [Sanguibacter sp. 4.1]